MTIDPVRKRPSSRPPAPPQAVEARLTQTSRQKLRQRILGQGKETRLDRILKHPRVVRQNVRNRTDIKATINSIFTFDDNRVISGIIEDIATQVLELTDHEIKARAEQAIKDSLREKSGASANITFDKFIEIKPTGEIDILQFITSSTVSPIFIILNHSKRADVAEKMIYPYLKIPLRRLFYVAMALSTIPPPIKIA